MNPRTHCKLRDEDVTPFREQYGRFGRYHLHLGIRLHDFLDACQWQLMYLEVVVVLFEMGDHLLPVCGQDFLRVARQSLVDLVYQISMMNPAPSTDIARFRKSPYISPSPCV